MHKPHAQLSAQARSSWASQKANKPALWPFSSPISAGAAPSHFLTIYSSHRFLSTAILGGQTIAYTETELNSPFTVWVDAPWTCSGCDEQNKLLQGELHWGLAAPNCSAARSAPGTDVSKLHLQSKWHLLPQVYPLGQQLWSNRHASDSHQSLSQGKRSWPSQPFNESRLLHVQ